MKIYAPQGLQEICISCGTPAAPGDLVYPGHLVKDLGVCRPCYLKMGHAVASEGVDLTIREVSFTWSSPYCLHCGSNIGPAQVRPWCDDCERDRLAIERRGELGP